jgi:hypothetical protein
LLLVLELYYYPLLVLVEGLLLLHDLLELSLFLQGQEFFVPLILPIVDIPALLPFEALFLLLNLRRRRIIVVVVFLRTLVILNNLDLLALHL